MYYAIITYFRQIVSFSKQGDNLSVKSKTVPVQHRIGFLKLRSNEAPITTDQLMANFKTVFSLENLERGRTVLRLALQYLSIRYGFQSTELWSRRISHFCTSALCN